MHFQRGVNEFVKRHGLHKVATDIAVPDNAIDEIMIYYYEIGQKSGIPYVQKGHIGDNHLHFNFLPRNTDELEKSKRLATKLLIKEVELGGTVTAEHGVGKKKYLVDNEERSLIELMYDEKVLIEMASLKNIFDPNHVLSIGNIIPIEYLTM